MYTRTHLEVDTDGVVGVDLQLFPLQVVGGQWESVLVEEESVNMSVRRNAH